MNEDEIKSDGVMKRIAVSLYMNNPEHKKVYDILEKQQNKNAYIREAINYYSHGFQHEILSRDDIRSIVKECLDDSLSSLKPVIETDIEDKQQKEQNHSTIDYDSLKNVF